MPSTKKQAGKQAGFRFSPELHQAFRQKCIREGRMMNAVVVRLIERWLKGEVTIDRNKKA